MEILNIRNLPIVVNICEQVLREVEKQLPWSMAHVIMNPFASSLLHNHSRMTEIYVITKGYGRLCLGISKTRILYQQIVAGSVHEIPAGIPHMLQNMSSGYLEHLVFALPPFNPSDVHLLDEKHPTKKFKLLSLPKIQDCFDGAKILSYIFPHLDLSIALGWVINNPIHPKQPHFHKRITEFIYVVDGKGFVEINRDRQPIQSGDWIRINSNAKHALINESPENLIVVCTCSPMFQMKDVYYPHK